MRRTCVPQFKVSTLTRKNNDFYSCHFSVENYQAIPSDNPGHARALNSNNESSPRTASYSEVFLEALMIEETVRPASEKPRWERHSSVAEAVRAQPMVQCLLQVFGVSNCSRRSA